MSQLFIQQYLNQLQDLRKVSGTSRESVVREAFKDLLKGSARSHDLIFVPEYEITTLTKDRRYVDGALLHALRVPFGYWEAKDEKDDLDAEIETKFRRGYPQDNIIFEDSRAAVLIQNRQEVKRCAVDDVQALERLLNLFFAYERPEIAEFRKAVEQFKTDIPVVLEALRAMIDQAHTENAAFRKAASEFLAHAQEAINPSLTGADVREMLIQHILTDEIFSKVFGEDDFHRQNNVARELYKLEGTFFTGNVKKQTLRGLDAYYAAIRSAAAQIGSHHEKQTFLKVIYENFYKVYNVRMADRLGVVYTPNEIVRFMIESADWLTEKHFGRNLIDKDVEILDPATGTGTFICELLEHFRGQKAKLKHKYQEELHANEVAILPYYVANLNIEATYAAITGEYAEFPNLCFVDTLDNVGLHTAQLGSVGDLFGSVSEENVARIKRQNSRKISVIIGNPPYNANQLNENENNKNREYPVIDKRIKQTYIDASTAQKTKLYDMYARFFRWASDRLNEKGVLAFVSNSSFINSRTFDGFRKVIAQEFNEIWIVDMKGNARTSGERRRQEGGNIFDDQIRVGIAVYFCVKHKGMKGCRMFYEAVRDYAKSEEKRDFLSATRLSERSFTEIRPDAKHNWINLSNNDFDELMPIANKETKAAKTAAKERAIFKLFSLGVATNRDEWVYDESPDVLTAKIRLFCEVFSREQVRWQHSSECKTELNAKKRKETLRNFVSREIKWTEELEAHLDRGTSLSLREEHMRHGAYRAFVKMPTYYERAITHRVYQQDNFFPVDGEWANKAICLSGGGSSKPFQILAVDSLPDLHFIGDSQTFPLKVWRDCKFEDNITDWALDQFSKHYRHPEQREGSAVRTKTKKQKADSSPAAQNDSVCVTRDDKARSITKEAIFHYVYAVLHDPIYREKYALNLKREFPRIPFYADFWQWADWGRELMDLHIGYESVPPWPLARTDVPTQGGEALKMGKTKSIFHSSLSGLSPAPSPRPSPGGRGGKDTAGREAAPRAILRADKAAARILLDAQTSLSEIPATAWDYRLGNRSALEWILDQYKEKKPKDPTIRDKFDTYRFADYKDKVIDLLMRVARVSVETQRIVEAMRVACR